MRSWYHSGHDILNAFDVKTDIAAYGSVKNLTAAAGKIINEKGMINSLLFRSLHPNFSCFL